MRSFSIHPLQMISSIFRHRQLILGLIRREVVGRYKGSVFGILWAIFNPIFMLAVYTFVFSVVFNARWSVAGESKAQFALVLFAGLMIFNLFSECVNRAPTLILSNANYVKKVIFPLEILPVVAFGTAFFHALVSFFVWLLFSFFVVGLPPVTIFLFPLALLPLTFLTVGLSWFLASLGVYMRDINQFIVIITSTLMFLTPIFYPIAAIPEKYHPIIYSNPLAYIIELVRNLLIFGHAFSWVGMSLLTLSSLVLAWGGFAWFQKTRKGFADVL